MAHRLHLLCVVIFLPWNVVDSNADNWQEEFRTLLQEQKVRLENLENEVATLRRENDALSKRCTETKPDINKRLLLQPTDGPSSTVAFYAMMSKDEPAPSAHFTLKFDVVKTNVGNSYNKFSGTFVAPAPGTYVFTYTVYCGIRGVIWLRIFVNDEVYGGSISDTQEAGDWDSDTTTIVATLKQGDSVNVRTTRASTTVIESDEEHKTTFAGWKLN